MRTAPQRLVVLPLLLLYAYLWSPYPGVPTPNEALPVWQAQAVVHESALHVTTGASKYEADPAAAYTDIVRGIDGQFYPVKPVAQAAILVPVFLLLKFVPWDCGFYEHLFAGRFFTITLPFVFFLYFFGRLLERFCGPAAAWGLIFAYAAGTNASVYATVFFINNLSAVFTFAAFWALRNGAARPAASAAAGALASIAFALDFSQFGMTGLLGLLAVVSAPRGSRFRSAVYFALGAAPAAACLLWYNAAIFGHPFRSAYDLYIAKVTGSSTILSMPQLSSVPMLLFSSTWGLYFYSPWLLGALVPLAILSRFEPREKLFVAFAALAPLSQAVSIGLVGGDWWAGWNIGPRYLIPVYPLAIWAAAAAAPKLGKAKPVWIFFVTAGIATAVIAHTIILVAGYYYPTLGGEWNVNFVRDYALPFLREGRGVYTFGHWIGLDYSEARTVAGALVAVSAVVVTLPMLRRAAAPARRAVLLGAVTGAVAFSAWLSIGEEPVHREEGLVEMRSRTVFDAASADNYSLRKKLDGLAQ